MNPKTIEFFEAEQKTTNDIRARFMDSLSDEERGQFAAIEKAVQLLVDAKIPFYLFPLLPSGYDKSKKMCWQWNSLGALSKHDSRGFPDKESSKMLEHTNEAFMCAFYNFCLNTFQLSKKGMTTVEIDKNFINFLFHCISRFERYHRGIEDEKRSY